ncbi:polysaccharide deacetylase [Paralimibaculum aggregatum]|uniref:Chitooligosaccharide deacetylase n=1 Tax=Paralimibaculum aggregatum TaxID=3036245 RepID=A0ABQ6LE06_9RHOB|nr:polysaccharide deacetylase [Limibaculum sp. NKW23]GMG81586.1 polysaccharide deacetylase [Limibaculum sp. NKW23]
MSLDLLDNPPPWPGGARCAVALTFDMDAESLVHLRHGAAAPGMIGASSALRYGPRIAVPRLARIARAYDVPLTVYIPGWCVETYPDTVRLLAGEGHEIGHHGWLHERPNTLSPADEATVLLRGIEAIEQATGARPRGYRAPAYAMSAETGRLLVAEGFAYDASLLGDDVPYMLDCAGGSLVELPSDYALDDWPQYVHMGEFSMAMPIRAPERAMEVFRAEFDAAHRHGGLWVSVFHPFVSGRLARAEALCGLIEHMQAAGDVWFATMAEIAGHVAGLVERGEWTPRREALPFWSAPVEPLVTP